MQVESVRPDELTGSALSRWRCYLRDEPLLHSPYLCPEFVSIVGQVRSGVEVAVIRDGGQIAAFLPFRRCGHTGRPIAGGADDCQALIAAPDWQADAVDVVNASGLCLYEFTHMRAGQASFAPYHRTTATSHIVRFTDGADAYERERRTVRKNLHANLAAKRRRLERQFGPISFTLHDPEPGRLHTLLEWKDEQNRRLGIGALTENVWLVDMLERIHAAQTDQFAGVLSTLCVDGRPIAAHMGMRSATVLHQWFPAYDRTFGRFSPGLILLQEMCRAAADAGLREIELGPGHEDYKARFANHGITVAAGFVGSPSLSLWSRQALDATGRLARRLPMGRAATLPQRLLRRIAQS